mmetsp:Transcript_147973/g.475134  ORF Transcript_147973/g.475134 Transcript_147973/m.475134 type:complete len:178 (-) Transcript_147973:325-858(-)
MAPLQRLPVVVLGLAVSWASADWVAPNGTVFPGFCPINQTVACPGSNATCMGNQCCPRADGAVHNNTFPCPSAEPGLLDCEAGEKVQDCLGPPPPTTTTTTTAATTIPTTSSRHFDVPQPADPTSTTAAVDAVTTTPGSGEPDTLTSGVQVRSSSTWVVAVLLVAASALQLCGTSSQ